MTKSVTRWDKEIGEMEESFHLDPSIIAGRIKEWRIIKFGKRGATRLARKIGMSPSTYFTFEDPDEHKSIRIDQLKRIAGGLGVPVNALIREDEIPSGRAQEAKVDDGDSHVRIPIVPDQRSLPSLLRQKMRFREIIVPVNTNPIDMEPKVNYFLFPIRRKTGLEPFIQKNDIVIIKEGHGKIKKGRIYLVYHGEKFKLRYIAPVKKDNGSGHYIFFTQHLRKGIEFWYPDREPNAIIGYVIFSTRRIDA